MTDVITTVDKIYTKIPLLPTSEGLKVYFNVQT